MNNCHKNHSFALNCTNGNIIYGLENKYKTVANSKNIYITSDNLNTVCRSMVFDKYIGCGSPKSYVYYFFTYTDP